MNFEEFLARTAEEYSLSFSVLYELAHSEFLCQSFENVNFECFESFKYFQERFGIETVTCDSVLLFLEQIKMEEEISMLKNVKKIKEDENFKFKSAKENAEDENYMLKRAKRIEEENSLLLKRAARTNNALDCFMWGTLIGLCIVCFALKKRHYY